MDAPAVQDRIAASMDRLTQARARRQTPGETEARRESRTAYEDLTDEQARANAASERLTIPATILAIVFIAILLGPSLMTLMSNT